jgi:hypothetical protein
MARYPAAGRKRQGGWSGLTPNGFAGMNMPSYNDEVYRIGLILFVLVLAICWVVYVGCRSWRKMTPWKRVVGFLLLVPHFLLVVCIVVSLLCGHPPQGSPRFNTQFVCAVLMLFIFPLPALAGTTAALVVFKSARIG